MHNLNIQPVLKRKIKLCDAGEDTPEIGLDLLICADVLGEFLAGFNLLIIILDILYQDNKNLVDLPSSACDAKILLNSKRCWDDSAWLWNTQGFWLLNEKKVIDENLIES
ncbi:hypothetical protein CEXT_746611 [Caerostris extrusa]|uniref:Uncharacterized protein n=1 Tax=Caerostris extrusa TaxID=172846 RepID=A0AAV4RQ27_CAEEX|nr:hypothetical protein CEXT_746611 [Caerostris extrusa]